MNNVTNIEPTWQECVYIETSEFKISGVVFMPKIGKKTRMLSEILNCNKNFLAIKNCKLEYKLKPEKEVEYHDFLQVNISTILILRPSYE